jgi:hypothetical protein
MTNANPDRITGTITIAVLPQENGQYLCQLSNTIMGNTVVENAKITVIEINSDLPVEPLVRLWS